MLFDSVPDKAADPQQIQLWHNLAVQTLNPWIVLTLYF